jgi:pimeloyl-ACP methyl ester carboxylesterase
MTTFVLLHGGGMGGWTWKFVRPLLLQHGHEVFTPTFTGFGERAHLISRDITSSVHVTDVVNVLTCEDVDDAVLVAHSYAGTIAPGVIAAAGGRIRSLVYLDAIVPHSGENVAALMGFMTQEQTVALDRLLASGEGPIGSGVDEQQRAMAKEHPHLMDRDRERWLLDHLSDQPLRCILAPIKVGAETIRKPVHYVAARHTIMGAMHDRARALGWTMHDHAGDHAFLVGDPEGTAKLILAAADAR